MLDMTDKVVAVTGGGSGIGRAIALVFAKQGAIVHILDVSEEAANAVRAEVQAAGGRAIATVCDVSEAAATQSVIDGIVEQSGRIDILINNAGIAAIGNVESTTEDDLDRIYAVNVKGIYTCSKSAVPHMVTQGGGVILNMASIASLIGIEDRFAYSMSKGAVLAMTKSIAIDYVKQNIRCNCVCPARIHTPFVDGFIAKNYPGEEEAMFAKLSDYQPVGRMGTPEEVANLILYLCSDEASFITGQAYPIDGGVLMG